MNLCNMLIQSLSITIKKETEKVKVSLTGVCKKMVLPNDSFNAMNANLKAIHASFKVCLHFFLFHFQINECNLLMQNMEKHCKELPAFQKSSARNEYVKNAVEGKWQQVRDLAVQVRRNDELKEMNAICNKLDANFKVCLYFFCCIIQII